MSWKRQWTNGKSSAFNIWTNNMKFYWKSFTQLEFCICANVKVKTSYKSSANDTLKTCMLLVNYINFQINKIICCTYIGAHYTMQQWPNHQLKNDIQKHTCNWHLLHVKMMSWSFFCCVLACGVLTSKRTKKIHPTSYVQVCAHSITCRWTWS